MRKLIIASVAAFAMAGLAACNSPADNAAEEKADALEEQAAAAPTEAEETALNEQADMIEQVLELSGILSERKAYAFEPVTVADDEVEVLKESFAGSDADIAKADRAHGSNLAGRIGCSPAALKSAKPCECGPAIGKRRERPSEPADCQPCRGNPQGMDRATLTVMTERIGHAALLVVRR